MRSYSAPSNVVLLATFAVVIVVVFSCIPTAAADHDQRRHRCLRAETALSHTVLNLRETDCSLANPLVYKIPQMVYTLASEGEPHYMYLMSRLLATGSNRARSVFHIPAMSGGCKDYRAVNPCPLARLRWLNRSAALGVRDAALDLDAAYSHNSAYDEGSVDTSVAGLKRMADYNDPQAMQLLYGVLLSLRAYMHSHREDATNQKGNVECETFGSDGGHRYGGHSHEHESDRHTLERALSLILGWTEPLSSVGAGGAGACGEVKSGFGHGAAAAQLRQEGVTLVCDRLEAELSKVETVTDGGRPGEEELIDPLLVETLEALFLNPPTSSILNQTCPFAQGVVQDELATQLVLAGAPSTTFTMRAVVNATYEPQRAHVTSRGI